MAARLRADGLVDYRKHHGVRLTETGEQAAQQIVHRHEGIERFLVHDLGFTPDEAHQEAEHMEHAVSNRLVDALERKLSIHAKSCTAENSDILPETE